MDLTTEQRQQQQDCQNDLCECHDITEQSVWSVKMVSQAWEDFGVDFDNINPVHESDDSYDKGYSEAYENR